MQARAFNTVAIDERNGILTKSSINKKKIREEIHYYLDLPPQIASYFPKLIHYAEDYSAYELEYLPYQTLSELILNNKISAENGREIIHQLLAILDELHFIKPRKTLSYQEICDFYIQKTLDRVNELRRIQLFNKLLTLPTIKINGIYYKNFPVLEKEFIDFVKKFKKEDYLLTAIHGDFCFSNILYFPNKKIIKLIDPRGSFAHPGIYGHSLYDFAKIMHCVHSKYDYIVNDKFILYEFNNASFYYEIPDLFLIEELKNEYIETLLERNLNLEFIYLIEASLFLSMASLHYENKQRQILMYLIGLSLFNQLLEGRYANLH